MLGSGWRRSVDLAGLTGTEIALADLPGFPVPTAVGHGRTLRSVDVGGRRVLLYLGRVHLYEGHDPNVVAHGVRTAAAAGCRAVVLTNGAGSPAREWPIGQPVLISDHLNLTADSPMTGLDPQPPLGPRFVDLTDLYTRVVAGPGPRGRPDPAGGRVPRAARSALRDAGRGPHGGDARRRPRRHVDGRSRPSPPATSGSSILGLSLATNLAAGISDVPLHGDDVTAAGDAAAERIGPLLRSILERLVR